MNNRSTQSGGWGFGLGILVGTLVGAAAAILLTPQSGVENRRKLAEAAKKIKDQAADLTKILEYNQALSKFRSHDPNGTSQQNQPEKKSSSEPQAEHPSTDDSLSPEGVVIL